MTALIQPKLRRFTYSLLAIVVFFTSLSNVAIAAPDGKALFQSNCASCHSPFKDATGPALKGTQSRVPSQEWLYKWVKNSAGVIASGDKYANDIYAKWNKTAMTAFPNLSNEDIDAIFTYVETVEDPSKKVAAAGAVEETKTDNSWLYISVTLCLAALAIILWRVNAGLQKVANEKQGLPSYKDVPVQRNKVFIALGVILAFITAGYWIANGAVEMGRQQNYQPEQPIFYSHKVHAGINQINCLYCHSSAEDGRMAMVPSTNVCMNCHKQVDTYTGDDLFDVDGRKVDGTAEIHKLYEYAGWDPAKKDYKRKANGEIDAKPIEWVKIHNLPDHVYFNHSQHVAVGKVQCQQCHGNIEEMDVVHQFASLSMGWCVNCHRTTDVQFASNNYYSIFEKYHKELKEGKRSRVTVEDIGGLECQKCHY